MKKLIEKFKDKSPTGLAGLILLWIAILIFEGYWIVSGETDLYLLLGTPGFFGVLTFIIMKWALKLF